MFIRKNHLAMIRSIAWSFHHTTGLDFKELFSEGCLQYCEAVLTYDFSKNVKLSTYAYKRIVWGLINYLNKEKFYQMVKTLPPREILQAPEYEFYIEEARRSVFGNDVLEVIDLVFESKDFEDISGKMARALLRKKLREDKGWSWPRIWNGIRESKGVLNNPEVDCII